jgi:excisionase family DNA binding protein
MMNSREVAEALDIGINKARALMKHKGFPSIRLGGTVRVSEEAFHEWIRNSSFKSFDV